MRIKLLAAAFVFSVATGTAFAVPGDQEAFNRGLAAYDAGHYEEAFNIFYELAGNDDLAAMRNVALMLRRGLGIERNPKEAMRWYERAALAGLVTAQADLAVMLLEGEAGDPDPEAAMEWLMPAATAGHPTAQYRLGLLYETGTEFMSPDLESAKKMYGAAAGRGQRDAARRLAELLDLTDAATTQVAKHPVEPDAAPTLRSSTVPEGPATSDREQSEGVMRKTFVGPPLNNFD
ncbi:MAG: tetratricopeptide repeat protein [Alphaproteobacteria bacterium]